MLSWFSPVNFCNICFKKGTFSWHHIYFTLSLFMFRAVLTLIVCVCITGQSEKTCYLSWLVQPNCPNQTLNAFGMLVGWKLKCHYLQIKWTILVQRKAINLVWTATRHSKQDSIFYQIYFEVKDTMEELKWFESSFYKTPSSV